MAEGNNAGPNKSPRKSSEKSPEKPLTKFGDVDKRGERDKLFAKLRKNIYHNSLREVFDNLTGIKHGGGLLAELIQKAMSTVLVNLDGYLRWNFVYDYHTLDIYALAAKATSAAAHAIGAMPPDGLPKRREQAVMLAGDIAAAALAEWFSKRPRRVGPTYGNHPKKPKGSNNFDKGLGPFRPRRAASGIF